jgi:hypothetical protein
MTSRLSKTSKPGLKVQQRLFRAAERGFFADRNMVRLLGWMEKGMIARWQLRLAPGGERDDITPAE